MIVQNGWKWFLSKSIVANLANLKVALAKADFDDTDGTLEYGDMVFADYPGYANLAYALDSSTPIITADPYGKLTSVTFTFQPVGIVTPQTIYGIFLYEDVTPGLICCNRFGAPVVLSADTDKIERGIDFYDQSFVV